MGCDIHSVAEVLVDGEWRLTLTQVGMDGDDDRCYSTFTVLAGVRDNGEWDPLDGPRGWPPGFESRLEAHEGRGPEYVRPPQGNPYWLGEHSHSWLLLSEILKFWNKRSPVPKPVRGFVTRDVYRPFVLRGSKPQEWVPTLPEGSPATRDPRLDDPKADPYRVLLDETWTYIETGWTPYGEATPDAEALPLLARIVKALKAQQKKHKVQPDQVRLVFGFDS